MYIIGNLIYHKKMKALSMVTLSQIPLTKLILMKLILSTIT